MGGFGSGRYGGKPTVESGLTLDLYDLMSSHFPSERGGAGTISWTRSGSGEELGRIDFVAVLADVRGGLWLGYNTYHDNGIKTKSNYTIDLTTTEQPFGGRRWWFICPLSGRRVSKLYLPAGALTFGARQAHKLAYRSQRETAHDRACSRAHRLRYRLGADGAIGDEIDKPKGMHWATFERRLERIHDAEDECAANLFGFIQRRL